MMNNPTMALGVRIATEGPRCDCNRKELRRRKLTNGSVIVGYQCLGCGRSVERIAKKDIDTSRLPWWETWRTRSPAIETSTWRRRKDFAGC
jgi:hypothetical protein